MKRVVLYSMNNCPHCQTAKKYLDQQDIVYRLCNVKTPSGQKEFRKTGRKRHSNSFIVHYLVQRSSIYQSNHL
ncbi:MAG: hypothetical protein HRT38_12320, partial [Alteromonadaceae bacterium]|nr:hypothetical protein [Alteromonadaceae bacterium]